MPEVIRVGIADDDEVIRHVLKHGLGKSDDIHVVAAVEDGKAAVALAQTGQIDVLVLDVKMPVMNGSEALRLIRVLAPDVRVLMHSSEPASMCAAEMLHAGAAAYLQKPCDLRRMIAFIREAAKSVPRLQAGKGT